MNCATHIKNKVKFRVELAEIWHIYCIKKTLGVLLRRYLITHPHILLGNAELFFEGGEKRIRSNIYAFSGKF